MDAHAGDVVFSVGAFASTWFVFRLWVAPRREAIEDIGTKPNSAL